jgi:hypothetical protein
MEHNVVFQLSGTKTFTISAPDSFRAYAPHSSLHPGWRQGQVPFVAAGQAVCTFHPFSTLSSTTATNTSTPSTTPSSGPAAIDGCAGSDPSKFTSAVWEVTLEAGDALYLPPMYFHSVRAGANSVSMNAWLGSQEVTAAAALALIPLPLKPPTLAGRSAALATVVRKVLLQLTGSAKSIPVFGHDWMRRFGPTAYTATGTTTSMNELRCPPFYPIRDGEGEGEGETATPPSHRFCPRSALVAADRSGDIWRAAQAIYKVIRHLGPAQRALVLYDYVEEALDLVLGLGLGQGEGEGEGEGSKPCAARLFIHACVLEADYPGRPDI